MRISDWSSDVCSSDLTLSQVACPPASLPLRKTGAKAGIEVFRDEPRTQPLSCAAGEGGAQRRLRADFSRQPGPPSPQPLSRFAGEGLKPGWTVSRSPRTQPLSCAPGEGGAPRRGGARLYGVTRSPIKNEASTRE